MSVQPNTGKVQEENQQDHTDDPDQHVTAPGCERSSRGGPRREH